MAFGGWRGAAQVVASGTVAAVVAAAAGVPPMNLALPATLAGAAVAFGFGGRGDAVPFAAVFTAGFALSDAVEGRGGSPGAAEATLALAAVATVGWAVATRRRAALWPLVGAGLLTLLGLYSARSGSAGTMRPWFAGWLPPRFAEDAVFVVRKIVHSTFYPLLAYTALRSFEGADRRRRFGGAFAFAAVFAIFDEVRQAGVPGRGGAARDVLLDLGATLVALAWLWRRSRRGG